MSQPKLQLSLPLTLTLQHFLVEHTDVSVPAVAAQQKVGQKGVLLRLKTMLPDTAFIYPSLFVRDFLLVKLNNWLKYSSFPNVAFLYHLACFLNRLSQHPQVFKHSRNDGELMAQILLESGAWEWLGEQQVEEVLQGSALVAATVVQAIRSGEKLMERCFQVVVLGLVSLHGRTNPYIPIVHQEKNHAGQILFAKRIDALIHLNPKIEKVNLDIVQDAYSLRCSPQVHGVSIDCLNNLRAALQGLANRPQTRQVLVKGKRVRNLALRAESEIALLDQLVMALNEVGHMSFLRAERILNIHLGKNDIKSSPHYQCLRVLLQKYSYLVGENKLLSTPSSADTIQLHDYKHDIYVHEGTAHTRLSSLLSNLARLLQLEVMAAIEVIFSLYHSEEALFVSQEMEAAYMQLVGIRSEDTLEYAQAVSKWLKF